jgi:hypothetical protein
MRAKLLARIRTLEAKVCSSRRPLGITIPVRQRRWIVSRLCRFKDGKLVELSPEERMQREPSR